MLDNPSTWRSLGIESMKRHDIEFAMRVYRHIGDVGMVWTLDEFKHVEDRKLLAGHVHMVNREMQYFYRWRSWICGANN